VPRHLMGRPVRLRRQPDDGHRVDVAQQGAELAVLGAQFEVSHGARARACSRKACTMKPVAPQIVASPVSYHHPFQTRAPSRRRSRRSSIADSVAVGTARTRAISARLRRSTGSARITATNGVTRTPDTKVWIGGSAPRTSGTAGSR